MRVLTIGTFDMLHEGHINFLRACAKLGELAVGVNSDRFVEKYKGKRPVMDLNTRITVLEALSFVHHVRKNDEAGQLLIRTELPDILAIGSDWAKKDYYAQIDLTPRQLDLMKIQLVYLPYTEGISSTQLRERL